MVARHTPVLYNADFTGCAGLAALSPAVIAAEFERALIDAGATIVKSMSHDFAGNGLTCVVILTESHAALHTWPETGTVNIDIFSCSSRLKSRAAIDVLSQRFGASDVSIQETARVDGRDRAAVSR